MSDSPTFTLALNLARGGYSVFPCQLDKKPFSGSRGCLDASTDPVQIVQLWRRYPGELIGIATGQVSGFDLLDIDKKHPTAMAWWAATARRIEPTRVYRSQSGGRHVYLRHADGVRNSASKLAKGVDVRGDGGYAIFWFAAGCPCLCHEPIAPWPDWLLACALWTPPAPAATEIRYEPTDRAGRAIEGVLRLVSGAAEGERNRILFWGATRLGERIGAGHISRTDANALLIAAARQTGLPEVEAARTIASAWKVTP